MKLADLAKAKANKVLGIDASTNSVAFCLIENDSPLKWGKINFVGQDIYEKIHDAKVKTRAMLDEIKSDYIAVEGAILVRSADAVIKLSYVYGVVIAELMSTGASVITISPTSWQAYIGNKNPTKLEKDALRLENPGYADSWYKNKMRQIRKQRTVDYFNNKYKLSLNDFDVADAFGIANYANKVLTER
ncbi:crossover junction endodeoxyribonuclease RuvC [Candidatus Poribacteria bacterium]|nr:crossover junction endodeoxyribonuclease RuvC [Candidatus Poribacteria bacterium]